MLAAVAVVQIAQVLRQERAAQAVEALVVIRQQELLVVLTLVVAAVRVGITLLASYIMLVALADQALSLSLTLVHNVAQVAQLLALVVLLSTHSQLQALTLRNLIF
jgi:hypothetical protein